jgi:DtxR family Mn-dependent transcriptional regulator
MEFPLSDLRPGQSAEVVKIDTEDSGRLLKLSSLGLIPGILVRLQQRSPAYVIWVGETQLSLDGEIARQILCRGGAGGW